MSRRSAIAVVLALPLLLVVPAARSAPLVVPAARRAPLAVPDLLGVRWISGVGLSPDGKRVVCAVTRADLAQNRRSSNLQLLDVARGPSSLRPLTSAAGMNRDPTWSPDGKRVAFVSSRGGDEPQLYLIAVDGGEATPLTTLATGAAGPVWSPDGKWLAFTSAVYPGCAGEACNARRLKQQRESKVQARLYTGLLFRHWNEWRDERRTHVFIVPASGGAARDLTPGPHDAPPLALGGDRDYTFSPDGRTLAYVTNTDAVVATSTNNDVFEVPLGGGKPQRISQGKGNDYAPRYSPDGRQLAWLSMARPGFEADRPRIIVRQRTSGEEREWTRGFDGHPLSLVWAPGGKSIVFHAPHRGQQELFRATPAGVQQLTRGLFVKAEPSLARDGRLLVFAQEAAHQPPEVGAVGEGGKGARLLTALNAALPKQHGFQRAEHVWFEGANRARIHGLLLKPPGFQPGQRYPALVLIHGGPQGMTGDDFHPRWNLQMFAAEGYVVLGVNFHGSLGFGQPFVDAISGDWGGKPYQDVLRGTEWLARQPFVEGQKICAAGASYGGYLVNWIATQTTRFRCLISHAGLYNLESKYGSTEELWFPEWELRGTPWTNREAYRRWSPHAYAEKLRTPTLVIHGQRDYRVPVEQALQLFTALQRQGISSQFLYFPDEDHFVQKPQNIELWWKTMRGWLARHLRR